MKSTGDDVVELHCVCLDAAAFDLPKSYGHSISIDHIKMYLVIHTYLFLFLIIIIVFAFQGRTCGIWRFPG